MTKSKLNTESMQCEITRCGWVTEDPLYVSYHDMEWGNPEFNNFRLFEMLCLEGQQAGLSWITILKKRETYRQLFHDFNPYKIAKMTDNDVRRLMNEPGVIRHKGKLEAIIINSKCYQVMENNREDFSKFVWSFVDHEPIINNWKNITDIPTVTAISLALFKALKKRGFKFVGATTCYAFMQACGILYHKSTMNIPFPVLLPRLIDSKWFNADSPCDEEAELTSLEQANQHWLSSIGQQYMKRAPLGKTDPEPMEEEADTDEEEGNDETDESEESHDEDEEEELRTSYSPARNNNELEPDSLDDINEAPDMNTSDQSALWPIQ